MDVWGMDGKNQAAPSTFQQRGPWIGGAHDRSACRYRFALRPHVGAGGISTMPTAFVPREPRWGASGLVRAQQRVAIECHRQLPPCPATRCALGMPGEECVAAPHVGKRRALSNHQEIGPPKRAMNVSSLRGPPFLVVCRFGVLCLEPKATKRRGKSSHISKTDGRGLWRNGGGLERRCGETVEKH